MALYSVSVLNPNPQLSFGKWVFDVDVLYVQDGFCILTCPAWIVSAGACKCPNTGVLTYSPPQPERTPGVPPCALSSFLAVALRPGSAGAGFVIVAWKSRRAGVGALGGDGQLSRRLTL